MKSFFKKHRKNAKTLQFFETENFKGGKGKEKDQVA